MPTGQDALVARSGPPGRRDLRPFLWDKQNWSDPIATSTFWLDPKPISRLHPADESENPAIEIRPVGHADPSQEALLIVQGLLEDLGRRPVANRREMIQRHRARNGQNVRVDHFKRKRTTVLHFPD
jgi:hypothetical protein